METLVLPMATGTHVTVTVGKVFGSSYGTVFVTIEGKLYECPVMFGGLIVHDDYKGIWESVVHQQVQPRDEIEVIITGAYYQTDAGRIPVVDVVTGDGTLLSVYGLRNGWCLPNSYALPDLVDRREYIAAVQVARSAKRGIWGDTDATTDLPTLLSSEVMKLTAPTRQPFWETQKAPIFFLLMIVLLFLGWRRWMMTIDPVLRRQRQEREQEIREKDSKQGVFMRSARRMGRGLGWFLFRNPAGYAPKQPFAPTEIPKSGENEGHEHA